VHAAIHDKTLEHLVEAPMQDDVKRATARIDGSMTCFTVASEHSATASGKVH